VNQNHRHSNHRKIDKVVTTVGGAIFIISKSQWNVFNGMDERLFRTQDRDLSLRMARKGIKGIRKSEVFGLHHTIPYNNYNRMILMLTNGSYSYKGIMIRKHLANTAFYPVLLREESSMIFLSISIVIGFFYPILFILYILIVVFRNIKHFQNYKLFVLDCLNRILKDIIVLASIIFYHPTKSKYTTLKIE
jgi:hypothetical protein